MTQQRRSSETQAAGRQLQSDMDALSLTQALTDFEVANARVLDLAQRLVEAEAMITQTKTELQELRIEHGALLAEHELMRSSKAYRSAEKVWALRNALRV
jgi:glycine cleavage system pyridoxal-binding protein P